jgi:hypothetical protein
MKHEMYSTVNAETPAHGCDRHVLPADGPTYKQTQLPPLSAKRLLTGTCMRVSQVHRHALL